MPITIDPEILGGAPVFTGTRVPVRAMWEYLEGGDSLDVFLDHFLTVSRELATRVSSSKFFGGQICLN